MITYSYVSNIFIEMCHKGSSEGATKIQRRTPYETSNQKKGSHLRLPMARDCHDRYIGNFPAHRGPYNAWSIPRLWAVRRPALN